MKNTAVYTVEAFVAAPIVDTSLALEVSFETAPDEKTLDAVKKKLEKLYGAGATVTVDGKSTEISKIPAAVKQVNAQALADYSKPRYNAADAVRIISRLTDPEDGCPWDRAQTHESIRINLIEEAYEAVDAIDKRDEENMREEFGDVFLQSLLQSEISRRGGEFDFSDVCDELCKKLISRHTWLFGGDTASNAADALVLWDKAKATEKNYDSVKNQLQRLPDEFPALLRCQKAHKKIKKSGAPVDPQAEFESAVAARDYVSVIAAACALLADEGKDAEVELNKLIVSKIDAL